MNNVETSEHKFRFVVEPTGKLIPETKETKRYTYFGIGKEYVQKVINITTGETVSDAGYFTEFRAFKSKLKPTSKYYYVDKIETIVLDGIERQIKNGLLLPLEERL